MMNSVISAVKNKYVLASLAVALIAKFAMKFKETIYFVGFGLVLILQLFGGKIFGSKKKYAIWAILGFLVAVFYDDYKVSKGESTPLTLTMTKIKNLFL